MKIGQIGSGEAFREKMLPALQDMGNYSVEWVVDILPEEDVRRSLIDSGFDSDFKYYKIDGFLKELPSEYVDVVIDASPNRYHANNLSLALAAGRNVFIEKPFAVSHVDIRQVEAALQSNPNSFVYFAEYCRDEKGLAFRALTGEIRPSDWYEQFITPGIDSHMANALDSLGKIKRITSNYLEGVGKKSGISHRLWLGDGDQGGQLLDIGTHLFTFPALIYNRLGDVSVDECIVGFCEEAKSEYESRFGREMMGETYARVRFRSNSGCEIEFAFGKYTGDAERWLHVVGENGHVYLDFETQEMHVHAPAYSGKVTVISQPKYSIIMQDLARRLGTAGDYMFDNSRRTLEMILSAREHVDKRFDYQAGQIPDMYRLGN